MKIDGYGRRLYKVEEVAVKLECSVHTIDNWYRWKRTVCADEEKKNLYAGYIYCLHEPIQEGARQTRYWTDEDIRALKAFRDTAPKGRNGIMGCTNHKGGKKWQESS